MDEELKRKYQRLQGALRDLGSLAVGFSGGVDSTLLLRVAHGVLGDRVLAVTATSEMQPAFELAAAKQLAEEIGARHVVIETSPLDVDRIAANPPDRCYHCKRALFTRVAEVASEHGIEHVADGTNADDAGAYRPGTRAAEELGVLRPLQDAGLTKPDLRRLSRELGLPTWDQPAYACLATRIPYGRELRPAELRMVDAAEDFLRELGFRQCRVRHHGSVARIEVEPGRVPDAAAPETAGRIARRLREIGFRHVTLDLQGYRSGSFDDHLADTGDE
ncbi:MAG: ATP-dependent sacrificial sulfur transferase LarE [Planctomycetota bacterium]